MINKSFWHDKRVFLTGYTGFKGSWLSLWLSMLGARVTGYALAANTTPSLFELARVEHVIHQSVLGDINDLANLELAMQQARPDIVIHMAAQALVRDSYVNPLETYQTNVMGTANVLECVRRTPSAKAVVVVTTDKCYENKEWCWGYRENDALGGYDPYSNSKACAELVVSSYRQSFLQNEGIAVATVRAGNVIGGGDWARDRIVPDCLRAIEAEQVISIRSPQAIRPWQHVLEPLNGYLMLAERLYEIGNEWAEGWNFGPNDCDVRTVGELVRRLGEKLNFSYAFNPVDELHEAQCLRLDSSKAKSRLKWEPKMNFVEALDWIVDWYNAYQDKQNMQEFSYEQIRCFMKK